jgi:hypothetical protein
MGTFTILKKGMSNSNKKVKVAIYLWIVNLLFAWMMVMPIYYLINNHVSRSLIGDQLLKGLDYLWLGDAFHKFQTTASIIPALIIFPLLLYLLFHIFLNGGIIGRLKDMEAKVILADFFKDCGAYFGRFFRLFLISIPGYLLLVGIPFGILSAILGIFTDNAASEWPGIITSNLRYIIFILLFSMVNMIFDYAKIRLVMTDSRKVIKETWFTFKFLFKRLFFKAWRLYLMVGLLFVICTIIYLEISNLLPSHTMFLILIVFIWQQIYMMVRMWIKLTFFSAQMEFYGSNS